MTPICACTHSLSVFLHDIVWSGHSTNRGWNVGQQIVKSSGPEGFHVLIVTVEDLASFSCIVDLVSGHSLFIDYKSKEWLEAF